MEGDQKSFELPERAYQKVFRSKVAGGQKVRSNLKYNEN